MKKYNFMLLFAPLEQFEILLLLKIKFLILDFSFTNFLVSNFMLIIILVVISIFNTSKKGYFYYISILWQKLINLLFQIISQLICDIILKNNSKYLPILNLIFIYILFTNLFGLIPYSFTSTSHLFVTFYLSFSMFVGLNIITLKNYGTNWFCLFLPSKTSIILAFVLIPIEFVSYFAKPVSLGVRLFINLMAGHTLLKVVINFSWNLLLLENFISIFLLLPMFTLVILFFLELGVAFIQSYVFVILLCIYIQDGT